MSLQPLLARLGTSLADMARALSLGKATTSRLVSKGQWPTRNAPTLRAAAAKFLTDHGAKPEDLRPLFNAAGEDASQPTAPPTDSEDTTMLLRCETLTQKTKMAFRLTRDPFRDDVQTRDDVFASGAIRYVRNVLLDAALHHSFVAVIGESGSGKSTLAEDLEQRVIDENKPVSVIRPYVLAMEESESRGKPLRAPAIAEAIIRTLTPTAHCKSSPEARFAQVHEVLRTSRRAGQSHLLLIEEAHSLPVPTLKHLKRFAELKDGLSRLIGIALIGQPELATRLSERSGEVREVVQRCELVHLPALDGDLEAYLRHKFLRAGAQVDDVLAPDAYDAIRARLIRVPERGRPSERVSICHPLVVNNLVARAMNAAALAGMAKVDGNVITGV
jgi:type II secretory pathway predicted ATPase ExeA